MVGPLLFVSDLERLVETSVEPWVPSQVDRVVSHVQDSQRLRGVRPAMTNAQVPIRVTNIATYNSTNPMTVLYTGGQTRGQGQRGL